MSKWKLKMGGFRKGKKIHNRGPSRFQVGNEYTWGPWGFFPHVPSAPTPTGPSPPLASQLGADFPSPNRDILTNVRPTKKNEKKAQSGLPTKKKKEEGNALWFSNNFQVIFVFNKNSLCVCGLPKLPMRTRSWTPHGRVALF